jgi:hypothetical protein
MDELLGCVAEFEGGSDFHKIAPFSGSISLYAGLLKRLRVYAGSDFL